jgi:hypothetical protein
MPGGKPVGASSGGQDQRRQRTRAGTGRMAGGSPVPPDRWRDSSTDVAMVIAAVSVGTGRAIPVPTRCFRTHLAVRAAREPDHASGSWFHLLSTEWWERLAAESGPTRRLSRGLMEGSGRAAPVPFVEGACSRGPWRSGSGTLRNAPAVAWRRVRSPLLTVRPPSSPRASPVRVRCLVGRPAASPRRVHRAGAKSLPMQASS